MIKLQPLVQVNKRKFFSFLIYTILLRQQSFATAINFIYKRRQQRHITAQHRVWDERRKMYWFHMENSWSCVSMLILIKKICKFPKITNKLFIFAFSLRSNTMNCPIFCRRCWLLVVISIHGQILCEFSYLLNKKIYIFL